MLSTLEYVVLGYLGAINVMAFFMMGFDKWMATSKRWRVSEKRLWLFALLGGSLGTLFGILTFRHKIRKIIFLFILFAIMLLQVAIVVSLWWYFFGSEVPFLEFS